MDNKVKIEIRDFNFFYGEKQVIFNLNLDIPANEIVAVFGPANSGITTLLRSLNRLSDLNPNARTEGEILLNGKNIFAASVNVTELRRKVGMVFEVPTPLPLSIYDNIALGPRLSGITAKSKLDDIVAESLKMAALWEEVKDRLNTPGFSLSGGQQQRLCIARVLALNPEVVMLDRACSGLDPISTAKIEESLRDLTDRFTIIMAPHNVKQAARVSDTTAFILMGELIENKKTVDLFNFPEDQRTYDYITGRFG